MSEAKDCYYSNWWLRMMIVLVAIIAVQLAFSCQHVLFSEDSQSKQESRKQEQKKRLQTMRKIAESIQTVSFDGEIEVPVELISSPIFGLATPRAATLTGPAGLRGKPDVRRLFLPSLGFPNP